MISGSITGDKKLDRKLKRLATSGQKRIVKSIDGAMMTVFLRGARNAVPPQYKSAKKALGRKSGKNKFKGIHETKFGFGVGKRTQSKVARSPKKPGVGITKENVVWLILGSKGGKARDRWKTGKGQTGVMPAIGKGWLKRGVQSVQQQAMSKAQGVARAKLIQEALKP